jgi:histidinol-phosphate aminotransferase
MGDGAASAPILPRLRDDLGSLPAYRAGQRPGGSGPTYSLASNESPFGPSDAVLEAIAVAARAANRYPDPGNGALVEALARFLGVSAAAIGLGTGSVALCQQAVTAAAGPGDEVVYAWRSFEAYPIITQAAGARAVAVPLDGAGRHDLAAMAAAVTERTRVLYLCSPNNPTGPALRHRDVSDFLATVPADLLVVLDEAYYEYVRDPAAVDGLALLPAHPNVLLLRTLSKAYGLAGLRVGYGVGHPDLIARLRLVALPFGVSRVAAAAGVAVLAEPAEIQRRAASVVAERQRVVAALRADGWQLPDAQGNFVWLPLADRAEEFAAACARRGFTVRAFPGEGVRVTVAEPAANDLFLAAAHETEVPA